MGEVTFKLDANEIAEIRKAINGSGGYQTLLRKLAPAIQNDGSITLDDETLGHIVRMCAYGPGGYQGRLRNAFRRSVGDLLDW